MFKNFISYFFWPFDLLYSPPAPHFEVLQILLPQFLILQNYKKKLSWCLIDWQLSIPNANAYSYPLPPLWRWGLNLDLNCIERVIINLIVPENYNFDTIVSDYFYSSPFTSTPPHLRVQEVHINGIRGISIHITESKIHISYSKNHNSTLFFYCFYMSPLPILVRIVAKGR